MLFTVSSSFLEFCIAKLEVWLVVCILWKIPTPDCQHASDGCWLKALIEFQSSSDTWLAPAGAHRWCNRVAKQRKINISRMCVYSGARYDCYKVVVFCSFLFSLLYWQGRVSRVVWGKQLRFGCAYSPVIISMNSIQRWKELDKRKISILIGHHRPSEKTMEEIALTIKINSSRTVGIDFIDHAIQIVIR